MYKCQTILRFRNSKNIYYNVSPLTNKIPLNFNPNKHLQEPRLRCFQDDVIVSVIFIYELILLKIYHLLLMLFISYIVKEKGKRREENCFFLNHGP